MNIDGEELIKNAHEKSVESAVISGLEDVNSTSTKYMNIQNLDRTFTKNVVIKELLKK